MFDVFYSGVKPGLFVHERAVLNIEQACELSGTRYFWWVNYLTDYTGFDFLFEPVPWEADQRHAWPSQWQKDSGTYLIPRQGYTATNYHKENTLKRLPTRDNWLVPDNFDRNSFDFSWHPDPTDPPYTYQFPTQHQRTGGPQYTNGGTDLKFVDQIRGNIKKGAAPIIEIDHLCGNSGQIPGTTKTVRYFDNYLDTLTRIARNSDSEYIWICSSICDYSNFDFSWHPEFWQSTMLHVFASGEEKFGDTFYMHVPSFRERINQFKLLDWYDINFVNAGVPRRPVPVIHHNSDTQVEMVRTQEWAGPLAVFTVDEQVGKIPTVPLWREKTKTIVPLNASASQVIVPRVAVPYIQTQLYDYPYIDRTHKNQPATLQDIVFISYDEPDRDRNWQILLDRFPRALRVDGVQGMELALEAAADLARTPWYYAVFAKTRVADTFNFDFVPDYMQQPKHYIFNCLNTVNQLEYGHMGIVMYNSAGIRSVNQAGDFGLDYTLSFPHESVPVLSCIGSFDQTPYHTWRTAFREAGKLAYFEHEKPTVEGAYRLNVWLTQATGPYAEWCLRGASDGVEFVTDSGFEITQMKQAFRWEWLRNYFVEKYGDIH